MFQQLRINPINFITSLSKTLELSNNGIAKHHIGTAIIARAFGDVLQLPQEMERNLIYAALLHDIGAARDWNEKHLIVHDDEASHVFRHAEEGYQILMKSRYLNPIADLVRHHHDRYSGHNPSGLSGEEIPLESRILHIADRIDVLIDPNQNVLAQRQAITEKIQTSDFFDPKLQEVLVELGKRESFWLDIVNADQNDDFLQELDLFGRMFFDVDDLISIARIFASIVDATSSYTAKHSENVAQVSRFLAVACGFSKEEAQLFYLAGLLHDLGKLSVPNEILNKEGPLNEAEFRTVKQHPYYSRIILQRVDGFQTIAKWIGQHHENLDGTGYPDRINGDKMVLGSRILQISDVFCALAENRPYRPTMSDHDLIRHLQSMADHHKVDQNLVRLIKPNVRFLQDLVHADVREN